jgi:tight adherence protein B
MTPAMLITATGLSLLLLLGGIGFGLNRMARADRLRSRLNAALAPHLRATSPAAIRPSRMQAFLRSRALARAAALFGIDPEQTAAYPLRWWMVLVVALPLSRLGTGLASTLVGDVIVLGTPVAWLLMCRAIFGRFHAARRETLLRQFPDALGMITRSISVGVPATEAIRIVAREAAEPTATEFRRISDRLSIGSPLDRALADTALRNGVAEYRFFSTALSLQAQTGGGLREALETLADVIRKRVALRQRGYALASEARTSAAILAGLPFFAGGLIALLNPSYVAVLVTDDAGRQLLSVAIGMLLAGIAIMRGMIRKALT